MRRFALLLLPLAAAALIVAGCGDDDANDSGSASASEAAMQQGEDDAMKADSEAMKGSSESEMTSEDAMKAESSMAAKGTRVKVVSSDYGSVIADGKGEAFYLFDKESSKQPRCYGACASVWPPVLTKGKPKAANGVNQSLLGTTERANGKLQVTYAGQPLYYYVDDSPGTILCHDVAEFGGLWLVVKPNGQAV
jgi:predicted lipoprotein with Yx(FWY)xxD motif